ncbi:MAG TPA: 23S rRNA (uracil(1939)-C(5))-methyltransferase RlmD [Clostridiales bacterium]|nr:23S rRNA (uracil(1939)-C(5))-methyltransferase RlmD [Clostridiales bacterium]
MKQINQRYNKKAKAVKRVPEHTPVRVQKTTSDHAGERNPNPCPLYRKCGGCQIQNMSYPRQLQWKQGKVQHLLGKFHSVEPIIGMENPYHYRNKVQAAFSVDRSRRIISGIYQSSSHRVVPVDSCMIEDETADRIIVTIRRLMKDFRVEPYDETTGRGLLRHVLVKRGFSTGEVMVVLVTVSPVLPAKNNFIHALLRAHPEITTVVLNINDRYTSMVLGEAEKVLYGPGYIEDKLCGCTFRISAKSFYQINPVQTEILYGKAIEYAALTGKETVIDAYCGIGTIGLTASGCAKSVIGVEVNGDAVRDAIVNARLNQIKNARFYEGDAGEFMSAMASEGERADVVFMDPPRAGSDRKFLSSLVKLSPQKVVYISCNPETQERDLHFLTAHGYRVEKIQPVDMFPHTYHVECVVLMSKVKNQV